MTENKHTPSEIDALYNTIKHIIEINEQFEKYIDSNNINILLIILDIITSSSYLYLIAYSQYITELPHDKNIFIHNEMIYVENKTIYNIFIFPLIQTIMRYKLLTDPINKHLKDAIDSNTHPYPYIHNIINKMDSYILYINNTPINTILKYNMATNEHINSIDNFVSDETIKQTNLSNIVLETASTAGGGYIKTKKRGINHKLQTKKQKTKKTKKDYPNNQHKY
jgi:hypothetical protein